MVRYNHPVEVPRSDLLLALEWTTDMIPVKEKGIRGDTFPQTWAADDHIYMGTGDPCSVVLDGKKKVVYHSIYLEEGNLPDQNEEEWIPHPEFRANMSELDREIYAQTTGSCIERLRGEPENFEHDRINNMPGLAGYGGFGSKPTGMISVNGVLYHAVQNLLGDKPAPEGTADIQHGSDATIICSKDFGKTWEPDIETPLKSFHDAFFDLEKQEYKIPPEERTHAGDWKPMFPGYMFGGPSFVQFGKDNEDAVDEYVYAVSAEQFVNGNHLRLGRVRSDRILDRSAWEFAIPYEDGSVDWTADLYKSVPILSIMHHISLPEMVYIRSIKKYILVTTGMHTDMNPNEGAELTIMEADRPWGPFKLVHYEWMWYKLDFGGYGARIPMKWFDQETLSGYMLQSGNWAKEAPREYYKPLLRGFKLIKKTKP